MAQDGSPNAADPKPLKPGWTEHVSPDGIPYYYHAETNESSWVRPEVDADAEILKAAAATSTADAPLESGSPEDVTAEVKADRERELEASAVAVEEDEEGASAEESKEQRDARRQGLKRKLEAPDMILEPSVFSTLAQWMELGEEGEEAAKMLAKGYRGYSDMVNLVLGWFDDLGAGGRDLGSEAMFAHVKKLIRQRFSKHPEAVGDVLDGSEEPPGWLLKMLEHESWRNLLIVLAGDSKNNHIPLLDFSVNAITAAGFHSEIAKVTNPSAYFAVFLRTFEDLLIKIITSTASGSNDASLYDSEKSFYKLCSHAQYTHFFAIEILRALEGGDTLDIEETPSRAGSTELLSPEVRCKCRRLRQGLADSTRGDVERNSATELLSPLNRREIGALSSKGSSFPELASLLKGAMDRRGFSSDVLSRFYDLYNPDSNLYKRSEDTVPVDVKMPPVWPLRLPFVVALLTKQLFQPFKSTASGAQELAGSYLLACATTRPQRRDAEDMAVAKETHAEVLAVQEAILASLKVCNNEDTLSIKELHRQSQSMQLLLGHVKKHPSVSAGVLLWIRACYCAPKFQRSSSFTTGVITFMYLIRWIIRSHPLQREQVFFVLRQIFPLKPKSVFSTKILEVKQYLIDEMIVLMQVGYVLPVIEYMKEHATAGDIDHSLLRHFVLRLLKSAAPPFSTEFSVAVKQLLDTQSCQRALRTGVSADENRLIQAFRSTETNEDLNAAVRRRDEERGAAQPGAREKGPMMRETIKLVPFK